MITTMLILLCLSGVAMQAPQQPAKTLVQPPEQRQPSEIRIFKVRTADPNDVLMQLGNLGMEREMRAVASSNRIIARGPKAVLDQVAEVIPLLDVAPSKASSWETVQIGMKYRSTWEIKGLMDVYLQPTEKWSEDEARNMVIVRASPETIERLRSAIAQVDQPAKKIMLDLVVLGPEGSPLKQMDAVKTELDKLGLADYGIINHVMLPVLDGGKFSGTGENDTSQLSISGTVRLLADQHAARFSLTIDAQALWFHQAVGSRPGARIQRQTHPRASLQSTLTLPLGESTIIGIAAVGGDPGKPMVLVARATTD